MSARRIEVGDIVVYRSEAWKVAKFTGRFNDQVLIENSGNAIVVPTEEVWRK